MKTALLFCSCLWLSFCPVLAQTTADLSAQEIFDKVVQYYDPNGIWGQFEGSMHMYTIGKNNIGEEDLTLNNAEDFYRTIHYRSNGNYAKGMKNGKPFFISKGTELDQVPDTLQKGPYNLNEVAVRRMKEHHTAHFSIALSLQAAGAQPQPEVSTKTLFGTECLGITFADGLPNAYEKGWYKVPTTLYLDPANNYRLHAVYVDNGWWKDKKGILTLMSGEIEVGGLKIPARKLYFDAANHNFRFTDVFSTDTRL